MPGFSDEPVTVFPTVPTTQSVLHATDVVRIGDSVAFISAMQMTRLGEGRSPTAPPSVLVNLRYLDDQFLGKISTESQLTGARFSDAPQPRDGEASTPLLDRDGVPLTTMFWKPTLGGAAVINALLAPAAGAFGVIAFLVLLMALGLRRLMKRDDEHLGELEQAHLELKAKEAQAHHLAYHDVLRSPGSRHCCAGIIPSAAGSPRRCSFLSPRRPA